MNIEYITGFFDADGSISMSKDNKDNKYKILKIDFTNTDKNVLVEIQNFLLKTYNLKLFISTKPARNKNHSISYTLSVRGNQKCLQLCKLLNTQHTKKKHRINTVIKYHNLVTKRNGKYSKKEISRKLAYERLFFCSSFH